MTTFTPPVAPGLQRGDPNSNRPADRLFSHYSPIDTGVSVWQDELGAWHSVQYPSRGGDTHTTHDGPNTTVTGPNPGLATAQKAFVGGHTYDIDTATALQLIAAGFGDRINIAPVQGDWNTEQLRKFDSKMLLTADGSHATGAPFIHSDAWAVQLVSGTTQGQSGLREWFLHSDTDGWTDAHIRCVVNPFVYGPETSPGSGQFIIPQAGIVGRAQFNSSTGKNFGITMNNGTIFAIPSLNIGCWHAFPDGTGFQNRQFSWPFPTFPSFPWGFEAYIQGLIVRVRMFPMGWDPESVPWDHPTWAKTLILDVDCGSTAVVPTPTGPGKWGIISAHLGRDPRSMNRIRGGRNFLMERLL